MDAIMAFPFGLLESRMAASMVVVGLALGFQNSAAALAIQPARTGTTCVFFSPLMELAVTCSRLSPWAWRCGRVAMSFN